MKLAFVIHSIKTPLPKHFKISLPQNPKKEILDFDLDLNSLSYNLIQSSLDFLIEIWLFHLYYLFWEGFSEIMKYNTCCAISGINQPAFLDFDCLRNRKARPNGRNSLTYANVRLAACHQQVILT